MFIGLNPSTANGINNDPTITRLMSRADKEGFGGLLAGNLYGLVSSNPNDLLSHGNPIGDENDDYLKQMVNLSSVVLCAWGSFPAAEKRANTVLSMLMNPVCLGTNMDGQPKHPLYVGYDKPMFRYNPKQKPYCLGEINEFRR